MEFTNHFEQKTIFEVRDAVVRASLQNKRSLLFGGVSDLYVLSLPIMNSPIDQIVSDLIEMNKVESIIGDVVPLEAWLRNASYNSSQFPQLQSFFREKADLIVKNPNISTTQPKI